METVIHATRWTLDKYADGRLVAHEIIEGNSLMPDGIQEMLMLLAGQGGLPFGENGGFGVGDGTDVSTTGLIGANKFYKKFDSGYPQVKQGSVVWKATFEMNEANFAWNEYAITNAPNPDAVHLNRRVQAKGVKTDSDTWSMTIEVRWK